MSIITLWTSWSLAQTIFIGVRAMTFKTKSLTKGPLGEINKKEIVGIVDKIIVCFFVLLFCLFFVSFLAHNSYMLRITLFCMLVT